MRTTFLAVLAAIAVATTSVGVLCHSEQVFGHAPSSTVAGQDNPAWSPDEREVWTQISTGSHPVLSETCPEWKHNDRDGDSQGASPAYILRGSFVSRLLADPHAIGLPPDRAVVISRAHIDGDVVVSYGTTQALVILHCSTVEGRVTFESQEMLKPVLLHGVGVNGPVEFVDVETRSNVIVRNSEVESVEIMGSRFERNLSLRGTTVRDRLKIVSTTVGHDLMMGCLSDSPRGSYCARYGPTIFLNVSISGGVDFIGSCFVGEASLTNVDVKGRFQAGDVVFSEGLAPSGDKFSCGSGLIDAGVPGGLVVEGANVERGMTLDGGRYGDVGILRTRVKRGLNLRNSRFGSLDLSGTTVEGVLRIGSLNADVRADGPLDGARFVARHTRVEDLRVTEDWWRMWSVRELDGFMYDNLSGFSESGDDPYLQEGEWYKAWLPDGDLYSPEPYMQLSAVLRDQGRSDVAEEILYASEDRKRLRLFWSDPERWKLLLFDLTLGYGIGWKMLWRALFWMAFFAIFGWGWAALNLRHRRCVDQCTLLWLSVSYTVPGFNAVKSDELALPPRVKYWFYLQQLAGYALAILAGSAIVQIFES